MKFIWLFAISILLAQGTDTYSQIRYFEFKTACGHGNWQDSTFVAAASNPVLIDTVLANLQRPEDQRNFINGVIDYGNAGYNRNASHWFLWHFVPDQWTLVENAIEVCDGCPYSDIDLNLTYWIETVGQFCPWTGIPVREITNTSVVADIGHSASVIVYPNPVENQLRIKTDDASNTKIEIISLTGIKMLELIGTHTIDVSALQPGSYIVTVQSVARNPKSFLIFKR